MPPTARIATWLLALAFAAAPSLAIAAQLCGECCCPPMPCHAADECDTQIASAESCSSPAVATTSVGAKRSLEAQVVCEAPPLRPFAAETGSRLRPPARAGDLDRLISPLRLSVVLRS